MAERGWKRFEASFTARPVVSWKHSILVFVACSGEYWQLSSKIWKSLRVRNVFFPQPIAATDVFTDPPASDLFQAYSGDQHFGFLLEKKLNQQLSAPSHPHRSISKLKFVGLSVAAALGATALLVARRAQRAERENPAAGKFLDISGVHLHYREWGEGKPLVLLHGNGTMVQDFEISGLITLLAREYRVVAFDRPGFGHTDRPRNRVWGPEAQSELFWHAIGRLGLEHAIVIGHSWGTMVALALALRHPESVRGLVLLSGYYFPSLRLDVPFLAVPAIPIIGDIMCYTISPLLGRLLARMVTRKLFSPLPVPPDFRERFPVALALRPSQIRANAAETALMVPAAAALSNRYGELHLPILIMAGSKDEIVNGERQSSRLHSMLPTSDLVWVEGAGHMVHHAAPEQLVDATRAMLNRPNSAERDPLTILPSASRDRRGAAASSES